MCSWIKLKNTKWAKKETKLVNKKQTLTRIEKLGAIVSNYKKKVEAKI